MKNSTNSTKIDLDLTVTQLRDLDKICNEMAMSRQEVIKMLMEMGFREYYETQALKHK